MSSSPRIGWRQVRLSDVCEIQLGKMLSPLAKTGIRYRPYLRNTNVQWGGFDLSDVAEMDFDEDEEEKFALRSGDLLVCEGGEPGRAAVWEGQINPCFYQKALHRLRPVGDDVDPRFVMYRLWLGAISGEFGGSHAKTTIAHLPAVRLATLSIAIPPLREQRRVVDVLNESFAAIELTRTAAEARLEAVNSLSGSYLRRAFGSAECSGWPRRQLGDLLATPLRAGISRSGTPSSTKRCLTLSAVRNGILDLAACKPADVSDPEADGNWVLPGAFYVIRGNGNLSLVGRGAFAPPVIEHPVLFPDLLIQALTDSAVVAPEYLRFAWDSSEVRRDIEGRARTAAGIYKINQDSLRQVQLLVPSLTAQRSLAAKLTEELAGVSKLQRVVAAELREIDTLPTALLRRTFSADL